VNEVVLLRGPETKRILQSVIEKKTAASMCYLSRDKWHVAKVLLVRLEDNGLFITLLPSPSQPTEGKLLFLSEVKPRPINVQVSQSVGLAVKHEGGKFIFETKVADFGFSSSSSAGIIMLEFPEQMELISRRSYFRVRVPDRMQITVDIWHRRCGQVNVEEDHHWQGKLIDLSAGGLQMAIDASQQPDFREGQFVRVRFAPMPSEAPLEFTAQIRNILPTVDNSSFCYGMQVVGLEASPEGRKTLGRLAGVTELYYDLNRNRGSEGWTPQVGLQTKTYVKRYRPDWGNLLRQ
jgi:hypothetical protein